LTSANEQGSEAALAVGNTPAFMPKVTPTINAAAARSIVADSLLCIPRYVPPGHQDQHLDGRRRTRCSPDANRPHCGWLYHSSSVLSCKAVMMAPWRRLRIGRKSTKTRDDPAVGWCLVAAIRFEGQVAPSAKGSDTHWVRLFSKRESISCAQRLLPDAG